MFKSWLIFIMYPRPRGVVRDIWLVPCELLQDRGAQGKSGKKGPLWE
jgi:hypothetical protein